MKLAIRIRMKRGKTPFSTLNSGLRDETGGGTGRPGAEPRLSVPSTRAYAMKLPWNDEDAFFLWAFSTLNSGLRDETKWIIGRLSPERTFSTLNSGLRDETQCRGDSENPAPPFSTLNSGLRDETLLEWVLEVEQGVPFSTLNSGLRDETVWQPDAARCCHVFQYPQLGPTR